MPTLSASGNPPNALVEKPASPLLAVENLRAYFPIRSGFFGGAGEYVRAVDDVSLTVGRAETLGLVGESGCGKTTAGRAILRLLPPGTADVTGTVRFDEKDVYALAPTPLRQLRREMQIVFQDPVGSLNPRMTVKTIIGEAIYVHRLLPKDQIPARVRELLDRVGLPAAAEERYPHEFSGGQRQRIGIARALALQPSFIVCDEPVSALDVSIQAQILNLLQDLQHELGLSFLFIAHNLAVVEHFSDRVAVMYLGKIVETAPAATLYRNPKHPYTMALLSAVPKPTPRKTDRRIVLQGELPSAANPPGGCAFHPRCPYAEARCRVETPPLEEKGGDPKHVSACWVMK